ncbi:MAG: hypothetical protein IPM29_27225 [Planctomycetes bacterium]|nr:hypothetical protein [Planctomycetota bacterium]
MSCERAQDLVKKENLYKTALLPIGCGMQTKRPGRGAVEDPILIAVPAACKSMASSIETLCAAVAARFASGAAGREAVDYALAEIMVAELTAAVERDAHAGRDRRLSSGRFRHWAASGDAAAALQAHELQVLLRGGDPTRTAAAPEWRPVSASA